MGFRKELEVAFSKKGMKKESSEPKQSRRANREVGCTQKLDSYSPRNRPKLVFEALSSAAVVEISLERMRSSPLTSACLSEVTPPRPRLSSKALAISEPPGTARLMAGLTEVPLMVTTLDGCFAAPFAVAVDAFLPAALLLLLVLLLLSSPWSEFESEESGRLSNLSRWEIRN